MRPQRLDSLLELPDVAVCNPQRHRLVRTGVLVLVAMLGGVCIAKGGLLIGLALIGFPFVGAFTRVVFHHPVLGLYATILVAFTGVGLRRYVPAPMGLLVDAMLVLTLVVILSRHPSTWDWSRLKNGLFVSASVWMLYNLFEIVNPEARSMAAWFYAVRGVALYMMLATPAALLLMDDKRHVRWFLFMWFGFSVLGTLWGLKQLYIGLDGAEQAWLSIPGNRTTHLLFGKLRVFSFYSDSGQFGAAQGHVGVVAGILALAPISKLKRFASACVAVIALYGMLISGTRGAMAVPFVGFFVYLCLSKNWKILILGLVALASVYGVLRYTHIAHNVYEVRRMRTAIVQGSDNPSLQVRLRNQERLRNYLQGKPFGGGVGSGGSWGQRFSPGTFLADLALDSWYVKIWAEQGIVGLYLYLTILAYLAVACLRRILKLRDPVLRHCMMALYCGVLGIAAASYGNMVLGQMPTGIMVYLSLAFIFRSPALDTPAARADAASDRL